MCGSVPTAIMFCPKCGQERASEATSFCSRCGFLLTGTSELLHTGGVLPLPPPPGPGSPRSRGIKQGLFILLLILPVVPIVGILSMALRIRPWAVGIALFTLLFGGLLRIAYSLMFESRYQPGLPAGPFLHVAEQPTLERASTNVLPPQSTYPASGYAAPQIGRWLDTSDLEPRSVADSTTKLLERDEQT